MVFENLLNPIFSPLLNMHPFLSIFIISLLISLLIIFIYKYTTNQSLMKDLKTEMKELQKEVKQLKDRPQEMMKVQKKAMQTNMKYMTHSLKPMLFTFLPIIIIFGWLNAHMAYLPITPGQQFGVDAFFREGVTGDVELSFEPEGITAISNLTQTIKDKKVSWLLKGEEGNYLLGVKYGEDEETKPLLINYGRLYEPVEKKISKKGLTKIRVNNAPLKPLGGLSIFGWRPGWLGVYIILSIVFSMSLRKILKIY